jgi:hypothetical protein
MSRCDLLQTDSVHICKPSPQHSSKWKVNGSRERLHSGNAGRADRRALRCVASLHELGRGPRGRADAGAGLAVPC